MSCHTLLKTARQKSGLSLRAAASLLGINASTLYRYEEGLIEKISPAVREALRTVYDLDRYAREDRVRPLLLFRRISAYEEGRQLMAADRMYRLFERLDQRGKRTVLNLLRFETRFGSGTCPPEGKP